MASDESEEEVQGLLVNSDMEGEDDHEQSATGGTSAEGMEADRSDSGMEDEDDHEQSATGEIGRAHV